MREQTIVWTALPNGVEDSRLKLSVFAAPQLKTDEGLPAPTLDQFPDFLDWPAHTLKFRALFSNTPPIEVAPSEPAPRSDLWKALFDSTTFVRPFEFQRLDLRAIRSYPVRHVQSFLRDRYVKFAASSGTDYPPAGDLLGQDGFGPIGFPNFPRPQTFIADFPDVDAALLQELPSWTFTRCKRRWATIPRSCAGSAWFSI